MNLTREQAIYECRKMWNWISEETIIRKKVIKKNEYFEKNNLKIPIEYCYLCEYSIKKSSDYKI